MIKKVEFAVPPHLKKFIEGTYLTQEKGFIKIGKRSHLGRLIQFVQKVDPYPKKYKVPENSTVLKLQYYDESYSTYFPVEKAKELCELIDAEFRRELICEVRSVHEYSRVIDYTPFVRRFLDRYGIIPDVDIEMETARKIYRDYLAKISKEFQKTFR
ncbi:hypothetical protein QM480_08955 [Flectobacillus sp. DC10W]|uniref:Uncharacterized protein n=1 Tax=Flectobacillus longus TaxID=2984207 RepID=A0ABT6YLH2_9BACT|nr:hypothetical protein [Flectobacillus longus]MDI9864452.1 hypothetical protein [Flectobacillus longus]